MQAKVQAGRAAGAVALLAAAFASKNDDRVCSIVHAAAESHSTVTGGSSAPLAASAGASSVGVLNVKIESFAKSTRRSPSGKTDQLGEAVALSQSKSSTYRS